MILIYLFLVKSAFAGVYDIQPEYMVESPSNCPKDLVIPKTFAEAKKRPDLICQDKKVGRSRCYPKVEAGKAHCFIVYNVRKEKLIKLKDKVAQTVTKFYKDKKNPNTSPQVKNYNFTDSSMNNALFANCKKTPNEANCVREACRLLTKEQRVAEEKCKPHLAVLGMAGAVPTEDGPSGSADGQGSTVRNDQNKIVTTRTDERSAIQEQKVTTPASAPPSTVPSAAPVIESPYVKLNRLFKTPAYSAAFKDFRAKDLRCKGFKLSELSPGGPELVKEVGQDLAYYGSKSKECAPLMSKLIENKCTSSGKDFLAGLDFPYVQAWAAAAGTSSTFTVGQKTFWTCGGRNKATTPKNPCLGGAAAYGKCAGPSVH